MKKFILLLLTPLVINAMEVDTSSHLETPTALVQRLQNAQSNRDKALRNELFGMVSKELKGVELVKVAASLKELYTGSKPDRDLFNSVTSYLVEQLIQRKQEKSMLDQWFDEENKNEKNIKELLTNEFNRQKQFQLVHLFTEKQYRHLQPLISSDCLSDEIKEIIYNLDSNDNPQYIKNLTGHTDSITSVAVTHDNHIVTGSWDNTAKIWNLDGSCIATLTGHTGSISSIAVTHDNYIVTGSWDRTAKIWNLDGSCIATLTGHINSISSIAVTHDNYIVTGSWDRTAKIWNHDGSCIATLTGHTKEISSVAITHDDHIVTGSWDNTAKIWNLDGSCIATLTGHTKEISSVAITHDDHIVTGSWDNTAKIWNLDGSCIATLTGHRGSISSVAITHDNHIVTGSTGSWDRTAKIWNHDGSCIATLTGHINSISSIAVTHDNHIVTGSENWFKPRDNIAKIWDLERCQQDITQEINNLTLKQLMLINYLDLSIKQGITFAPKSTREAVESLPPLIRKNIEKRIKLPTKASTTPCTIL